MSDVEREIAEQPESWREAAQLARNAPEDLPAAGIRLAVTGCGTSWFMAQAFASLRESLGHGETDAFAASEMPPGRAYEGVLAISRSGTTSEVLRALEALPVAMPVFAVSAVAKAPIVEAAGRSVVLDFADERSIVQTKFATSALALFRTHLGQDVGPVATEAEEALEAPFPADPASFDRFVFLGRGWTTGLAAEAALKFREAAGAWSEAYPAMEYRHGPISVAGPRTLAWVLGSVDAELAEAIAETEATLVGGARDPMADLVLVQRAAVALARSRGLDPDHPKHLTRSVVLP